MRLTFLILLAWSISAYSAEVVKLVKLEDFFKGKSDLEKPFELRDPFQQPLAGQQERDEGRSKGIILGNEFTNIAPIATTSLDQIKIVGTIVGDNRKAIAQIGSNNFILEEGMKLGTEGAELKAILPAGVVLVEKITNVYGQDEYLETIIPISVK